MQKRAYACLLSIIVSFFVFTFSFAQNASHYNISTGTNAALSVDKNGNPINFSAAPDRVWSDYSETSAPDSIGFTFIFMGRPYTIFRIGHYGLVGLTVANPLYMTGSATNDLTRKVAYPPSTYFNDQGPVIAPFWDAMRTARTGATVRSIITGAAPYRCRVVEWNAVVNSSSTTATQGGDATFQARLYETTGEIEYVYGNMTIGPSSGTVTASIGFTAGDADDQFTALQNLTSFPFTTVAANEPATQNLVNSATPGPIAGLHSTSDDARRYFRFLPPVLDGNFTNISISEIGTNSMRINWTETSTNKALYTLYRSTDDIHFTAVTDLPANSTNYMATSLSYGQRYYWKLTAFTEGTMKTSETASDSTRCTLTGTYSVGPNGRFTSLKQAFDTVGSKGMIGDILLELQSDYTSATEIFPLVFPKKILCRLPGYRVTIRPAANANNVELINNSNTSLLVIDSTENIVIDGRPGGAGTAKALTLASNGAVIEMRNASGNTIQYVKMRSALSNQWMGAISMAGSKALGCNNNLISQCDLYDGVRNMPRLLVRSYTETGTYNSRNQITRCNLFNFRTMAISLEKGNKEWQITGNSFYATQEIVSDSAEGGIIVAADVEQSTLHRIEDNYFGGSAPGATGSPMRISGYHYNIIYLGGNARIARNVFKRIKLAGLRAFTMPYPVHKIIYTTKSQYTSGLIDSVVNNQFGGSDAADSLAFYNNAGSDYEAHLISGYSENASLLVSGNVMQNISVRSPSRGQVNFYFINSSYNTHLIHHNQLGTQNGINSYTNYSEGGSTMGIAVRGGKAEITNNIITRWKTDGPISGIYGMPATIYGPSILTSYNTISHLATSYDNASGTNFYSVSGIYINDLSANGIRDNIIYALSCRSSGNTYSGSTIGIAVSNNMDTTYISRNLVHSLDANHGGVTGIQAGNVSIVENNVVRLGLDTAGNTLINETGLLSFLGIEGGKKVIHNTIYIGGTTTADPSGSVGISIRGNTYNNIVVVKRNAANSNSHGYVVQGTINPLLKVSDNNLYYHSGIGSSFSYGMDSLYKWRNNTRQDINSTFAEPHFIRPDGPAEQMDLRLTSPSPAEGKGNIQYTTPVDMDSATRKNLTQVDIGAYAANLTLQDNWLPVLTPDSVPGHHIDSVQIIRVRMTDDTGIDTSTSNQPRVWFRRFYPSASNWYSLPGQLYSGNVRDGKWQFPINYAAVGLPLTSTDSLECYFVARDITSFQNIGLAPLFNGNHYNVNTQNNMPSETYHYKISGPLADTLFVGKGQKYTSLTNNLGAFQAINAGKTGNKGTVVVITSDLGESGHIALNNFPANGGTGALKIITNTPVVKVINITDTDYDIININSSKNITINGSVNGAGRYLRFTNSFGSTIHLGGIPNKNITLQNLVLETSSASGSTSNIILSYADSNIVIRDNEIKGSVGNPGNAGPMYYGISAASDVQVKIIGNEISNFTRGGINCSFVNDSCVIQNNQLFYNLHRAAYSSLIAIGLNTFLPAGLKFSGGHTISGNYIGGSAPYCSGDAWDLNSNSGTVPSPMFIGILTNSSQTARSYVYNNTVQNIHIGSAATVGFSGISMGGLMTADGNIVGHPAQTNNILVESRAMDPYSPLLVTGISVGSGTDSGSVVTNNTVGNITATSDTSISIRGIAASNPTLVARNTVLNLSTNGNQALLYSSYSAVGLSVTYTDRAFMLKENAVLNIHSSGIKPKKLAAGIQLVQSGATLPTSFIEVSRNRVSNVTNRAVSGAEIAGLLIGKGPYKVINNEIALTNSNSTNAVNITGLGAKVVDTGSHTYFYFNSIYIGGSATGADTAYAVHFSNNRRINRFKNNLLYNGRTGSSGLSAALGVNMPSQNQRLWSDTTSDYNFLVATDTIHTTDWQHNSLTLRSFKNISRGDSSSFAATTTDVPADSLFVNTTTGDLSINTTRSHSWYVNGKGLPVEGILEDFSGQPVRSTTVATGPVDIGADEFAPATDPSALLVNGRHAPGGADTLSMNGRIAAVIQWENTGTLPSLDKSLWYSGIWPNDTTNNGTAEKARFLSGFWKIPAIGGSGYRYSITFYYDSSMIGKVRDIGTMVINKKQTGVAGSWKVITPTIIDRQARTITVTGQTSFSEFTATDAAATLQDGAHQPDLAITHQSVNMDSLYVGNTINVAFTIANTGQTNASSHKVYFYLSPDAMLTPGLNKDTLIGVYEQATILAAGANTGLLHQSIAIPCNIPMKQYNLFVVADGGKVVDEVDETNNTRNIPLFVKELKVNITQQDSTICNATVPLVAAGATNYTWSPAEGLNNIQGATVQARPAISTTYYVTGSNGQCTSRDSVSLTVHCENNTDTTTGADVITKVICTPNPTNGLVKVSFTLRETMQTSIMVLNQSGIPVYRTSVQLRTGHNIESVNLKGMPAGIYYIRIIAEKDTHVSTILLVR